MKITIDIENHTKNVGELNFTAIISKGIYERKILVTGNSVGDCVREIGISIMKMDEYQKTKDIKHLLT